ncbi:tellurite resistance TerB family protein [Thalassobaculum sp.]|uniref:tellurite resistance TerB family protein n=1 Tax=Thalassobaculum sp. TaxID=2022740 RepID=UPI003B5B9ACD
MDVQRLLDGFLGNGSGSKSTSGLGGLADKMPGGLMGGAAAGGLVAALLSSKKARKLGGKAITYGGLAVLGGLAYKAWSDHRANRPEAPATTPPAAPPADSGFDPARLRDTRGEDFRLTLVRAMVSAALADGHIDAKEQGLIDQQIGSADLAEDERRFISDQLDRPADPIAIASLCADEPQATEVYLASLVVLDPEVPGDARYKQRLGDALRLPDDLRRRLEREVEAALADV